MKNLDRNYEQISTEKYMYDNGWILGKKINKNLKNYDRM